MGTELISTMRGGVPPTAFLAAKVQQYPRQSVSQARYEFWGLFAGAAGALGWPLLRARDEEQVLARIDEALESGDFQRAVARIQQRLEDNIDLRHDLELELEDLDVDALPGGGDPEVDHLVCDALRFHRQSREAWSRFFDAMSQSGVRMEELEGESLDLDGLGFLSGAPVPIARLMLASARGAMASFGVTHALADLGLWEIGRVRHLAKLWRDGAYASLCLVASLPPAEVPISLVPEADRVDLGALAKQADAERARLEEMLESFERGEAPPGADDLGLE